MKKSNEEWGKELTPEQYAVCRQKGTETAFTGEYLVPTPSLIQAQAGRVIINL